MVAKENQPTLKQDIEALFVRADAATEAPSLFKPAKVRALGETPLWNLEQDFTLNLGHGRLERRTLREVEVPSGLREMWPMCNKSGKSCGVCIAPKRAKPRVRSWWA